MIYKHSPLVSLINGCTSAGLALSTTCALAESVATEAPGVSAGTMLQTLLGLLLVVGLLFLAAYLLRRMNGAHGFGNGPLKVIGGLVLGARERVVLVEIDDTWLIIGVVPGQIRTLHTMPKGEPLANVSGEKPFGHWLKQIIERKNET